MYKLKHIYDDLAEVDLPDGMYKLKSYYDSSGCVEDMPAHLQELEKRQDAILARLNALKSEVERLKRGSANVASAGVPNTSHNYRVMASVHTHSSINDVHKNLRELFKNGIESRLSHQVALTLIWKQVLDGPVLMVDPQTQSPIYGEANISRYMARLLGMLYENLTPEVATEVDAWLDQSVCLSSGSNKDKSAILKSANTRLARNDYLVGAELSLADIVMWSAVHQSRLAANAPGNVKKWLDMCARMPVFKLASEIIN